jgi:hypothetical protein
MFGNDEQRVFKCKVRTNGRVYSYSSRRERAAAERIEFSAGRGYGRITVQQCVSAHVRRARARMEMVCEKPRASELTVRAPADAALRMVLTKRQPCSQRQLQSMRAIMYIPKSDELDKSRPRPSRKRKRQVSERLNALPRRRLEEEREAALALRTADVSWSPTATSPLNFVILPSCAVSNYIRNPAPVFEC